MKAGTHGDLQIWLQKSLFWMQKAIGEVWDP